MEEKYGEVEEMNVCDNLGDHLVGNVYVKVDLKICLLMFCDIFLIWKDHFIEYLISVFQTMEL